MARRQREDTTSWRCWDDAHEKCKGTVLWYLTGERIVCACECHGSADEAPRGLAAVAGDGGGDRGGPGRADHAGSPSGRGDGGRADVGRRCTTARRMAHAYDDVLDDRACPAAHHIGPACTAPDDDEHDEHDYDCPADVDVFHDCPSAAARPCRPLWC